MQRPLPLPTLVGLLLLCVSPVTAQWELINEQYTDSVIRDVNETGPTGVAQSVTRHLFQLFADQDTWDGSTTFNVVSPSGEPLYDLIVTMPQPPSRRYQRVLAGYRPRRQQLSIAEVCEYTAYTNPLGEQLNATANLKTYFPEFNRPPGAIVGSIVGTVAVVGIASFLGAAYTGDSTGYCPTTFGFCLCPEGQCVVNALDEFKGLIDANSGKIETLFEYTSTLFNDVTEINFAIDQVSQTQQMAIEANRDVSAQLEQSMEHMAGSVNALTEAFYTQEQLNQLSQAQIENLNAAQQQGLIATEILAQRTQEEIDEMNLFITNLAVDTQLSFDYLSTLMAGQDMAITEGFNETFDRIEQVAATSQEVADLTNMELRILQVNVNSLAQELANAFSLMFQQQENNIVRDTINIAMRQLLNGVQTETTLFPFIEDFGTPPTNISDAPFEFTRFPLDQLTYLTAVDYVGDVWWYETTYNMFVNPYFMMNAGSSAPDYPQLLQTLGQNEQIEFCSPGDNESSAQNSGCTVWVERTLIRCVALNSYETLWQDKNNILIDFDSMCNPSSVMNPFDQTDFNNQLNFPSTQYTVYTNATNLVQALRHTALGWDVVGSEGVAFMVPLADLAPPVNYPDGAVRATSRRAGSVANVPSFDEFHMFQSLETLTTPYPRGNDPVSYFLRAWESSYTKTLAIEIYRLRVGTKGTLPTGGVETTYRPFAARDPNTDTAAGCYRSVFASTSNDDPGTDPVYRFIPDSVHIPLTLTRAFYNGSDPEDVTNQFLDAVINYDDPLAAGVIPVEPAMSGALDQQTGGIVIDAPQSVMSFAITPSSRDYLYSLFPREGQLPSTFSFAEWAALYGGEFWDPLKMLPTAEFYERYLEQPLGATLDYDVICSPTIGPNENALPNEWCLIYANYLVKEVQGAGECDPAPCPDRYGPNAEMDCALYCEFFEYVDFIPRTYSITLQLSTEEDFNLVQQVNSACPEATAVYDAASAATSLLVRNNNPGLSISAHFSYETVPPFGCPGLLPTDFSMSAGSTKAFDFTPCLESVNVTASITKVTGELCSSIDFTAPQRNTFVEVQLGNPATYGTAKRVELDAFNNATWDMLGSWAASTDIFLTQPVLEPGVFASLFTNPPGSTPWNAAFQTYQNLWDEYFPLLQNTTASLNFTIQAYQQNLNTTDNLLDAIIPYIQNGSALLEENRELGEQAAILNQELHDNIQNATFYLDNVNQSINQTQDLVDILNEDVYNASLAVAALTELVIEFNQTFLETTAAFQQMLDDADVVTGAGFSSGTTSAFVIAIVGLIVAVAAMAWACVSNPPIKINLSAPAPAAPAAAGRRSRGRDRDGNMGSGTRRRRVNNGSDGGTDEGDPLFVSRT